MSLLNKLTIKNLKLNKKRTRVTIIGIILSVALITSVANIFYSFKASIANRIIEKYGNYHYYFENVPSTDIKYFKENRYVEDTYLTQTIGYSTLNGKEDRYLYFAEVKGLTDSSLNNLAIKLTSGNLPQNNNEIIIPSNGTNYNGQKYKVGDTITFDLGTLEDPHFYDIYNIERGFDRIGGGFSLDSYYENKPNVINTKPYTYKIVGIYEESDNDLFDWFGRTYITKIDENNLTGNYNLFVKYNKQGLNKKDEVTSTLINADLNEYKSIVARSNSPEISYTQTYKTDCANFLSKIKYLFSYNSELISIESNWLNNSDLKPITIICLIVLIIIIITSIICIKNSFDISVTEKIKQYGMLSSIGATKKQIRHTIFFESFILSIISIPLGILTGCIFSFLLLTIANSLFKKIYDFKIIFSLSTIMIIISIIISLITISLSSLKSAFKASFLKPIEAIRNSEEIKIKKQSLKVPSFITKIFNITGEISYKNLKRNNKKYRPIIISLVICLVLFISLSYFINLIYVANLSDYEYDHNMRLILNETTPANIDEVYNLKSIASYSSIAEVYHNVINYPLNNDYSNFLNNSGYALPSCSNHISNWNGLDIIKLGDKEYKRYLKELGLKYDDLKDKGILLDKVTYSKYDNSGHLNHSVFRRFAYQVGDKLTITSKDVSCDTPDFNITNTYSIEIGAIPNILIKNPLHPLGYDIDENVSTLILSDELFNKLYTEYDDYNIYINSTNPSQTEEEINKILNQNESYTIYNYEQEVKNLKSIIIFINIFLYSFLIIVLLISITNIFTTITTSMQIRQKEFAMLKSVGMTKKEFNKMTSLESIFIGLKALLFGLPIGCYLSYVIYDFFMANNDTYTRTEIPFNLPYQSIIISLIVIILLVYFITRYSLNKNKNLNIIETIRKENI